MPDTHVIVKLMKRRTFACKARDNEVHYTMAVSALRGKKKKDIWYTSAPMKTRLR